MGVIVELGDNGITTRVTGPKYRPNAAAEALVAGRVDDARRAQKALAAAQELADEYGCTCNGERNFCKVCADVVKSLAAGPNVHKKADGYLLVRADGSARFLGFWESVKYWLYGNTPNA